ncbi:MAG: hypothetical protein ACRELX_02450, partial [Longimicrobiales bacterium]
MSQQSLLARTILTLAVCLAFLALDTADARTQEVAPATTDTLPDRWDAALDFGFNGSTGNTSLIVLTTGFRIKHLRTDRYELEWSVAFRYGESEDAVVARALESG